MKANHADTTPNLGGKPFLKTIAAAIILCAGLTSCGGPKYEKKFSAWFKMHTAEHTPVKIDDVDVDETAATGDSAVFQFTATGETTENLYTQEDLIVPTIMLDMQKKFQKYSISDDTMMESGAQQAFLNVKAGVENAPVILKITTPKGKEINIKGKARATLGKVDWDFMLAEVDQDPMPGTPHSGGKPFVVSGSKEHKALVAEYEANIKKMTEALELAKKIEDEKNRVAAAEMAKNEEETKARLKKETEEKEAADKKAKDEFLAKQKAIIGKFAPGTYFLGNWQAAECRGTMGMTIGQGTKIGDTYSMDATITNTPEKTKSKKINLMLTGKGTASEPFTLMFATTRMGFDDKWHYGNFRNNSTGFVTTDTEYKFQMVIDEENTTFNGTLKAYGDYGPIGPVTFEFQVADPKAQAPEPLTPPEIEPETEKKVQGENQPEENAGAEEIIKHPRAQVEAGMSIYAALTKALMRTDIPAAKKQLAILEEEHPGMYYTFQGQSLIYMYDQDYDALEANIPNIDKSTKITKAEKKKLHADYAETKKIMLEKKAKQ